MFSVGDLVIVVGLTYLVHRTCRAVAPAIVAALPLASALSARVVLQELGDDMRLLRDHCHQLSVALGSLQDSLKRNRVIMIEPQLCDSDVAELLREDALSH